MKKLINDKEKFSKLFSLCLSKILCGTLCNFFSSITRGYLLQQYRIIFLAMIFGVIPAPVFPQSLSDYLKIAAENNPGLKSKFYSYRASLEKAPQAGSLPDPQLSFGIFIEPMERYMGNQIADISLMQMFPWFGTLGAAEDEAAAMAKAKYEAFNEAKTMMFYEVKAAWYGLYLIQKQISITEENIEILETLEEIAVTRLKSGNAGNSTGKENGKKKEMSPGSSTSPGLSGMNMQSQTTSKPTPAAKQMDGMISMSGGGSMVDVLRVQLEINELKNNLALLNDSKHVLIVQFNKLLNRDSNKLVKIPDTLIAAKLPAPVKEIPDSIRMNNPMIRMLEKEEEAFLARERMNRKMGFPMIGIGLQYSIFQQRPGSTMKSENMIMPMASISIPLWRGKYDASVKESQILNDSVIEQRNDAGNKLIVGFEEANKNFKDAERRIELYGRQSNIAGQALNILISNYSSAGSGFEEILRMRQQLLDYKLNELNAVVDQNIAAAMIERLMGRF